MNDELLNSIAQGLLSGFIIFLLFRLFYNIFYKKDKKLNEEKYDEVNTTMESPKIKGDFQISEFTIKVTYLFIGLFTCLWSWNYIEPEGFYKFIQFLVIWFITTIICIGVFMFIVENLLRNKKK